MPNYDDIPKKHGGAVLLKQTSTPPAPPPTPPAANAPSSSSALSRQMSRQFSSKGDRRSSEAYRRSASIGSESPLPLWFNDLIENGFDGLLSIVTKNLSEEKEEFSRQRSASLAEAGDQSLHCRGQDLVGKLLT